ncbi:alanine/glycine:cation symporter family protein [Biformimicrobium ophioploci]|uniref:Sodium:alanine symporter family protein n=1 Tax=Biformimicrobium ophioploci TaxID=3036711 RepID=A0ABQ6M188_9GAMM|nr:alanine/glycine:cation symporter family protein [Microbulbifer sp. NKW57]GMG88101.1 sodium:alanine symporter family protein [Microbulbifer sp. NKW57]
METLSHIVQWGNSITWGGIGGIWWLGILIVALLPIGFYFTVKTRFIQLRSFGHLMHVMRQSFKAENEGGVSSFQAFATSAAARIGTGNIAGVAVAITAGGPGAIFWMWMVAIVGMATSFIENTLGQAFKEKGEVDGTFRGGPAYYIDKGLGHQWKWLSVLFSIFLVISFGFFFNAIQSNSMSDAINEAWGTDPMWVGVIIAVLASLIVFGGIKSIGKFAGLVVPVMALSYLAIAFLVIILNIGKLPGVLAEIVTNAFGIREAGAGTFGAVIASGIKRGLFSNEAGMGSSPNAGAAADVKHPAVQGYVQMASVFLDTLMICTATAAIILLSDAYLTSEVAGVTLTQQSLSDAVGGWGADFIALALIFFAFTSIIANYYYAETNIYFIWHSKASIWIYRALFIGFILFGAYVADTGTSANFALLWNMADMSMGFMASLNIFAVTLLSGVAFKLLKDYEEQLAQGIDQPSFDASKYNIKGIDTEVWNGGRK